MVLFAVAERVMHRCVDEAAAANVITQVLLALGDLAVCFRLTVVEVVIVGVVGEEAFFYFDLVTV